MEGHFLLRFHSSRDCCLCHPFWSFWSRRPTGSDCHSNRTTSRLLLSVVVCTAFVSAPGCRDAHSPDRSCHRNPCPAGASVCGGRRREKLEAQTDCRSHHTRDRCSPRHSDSIG